MSIVPQIESLVMDDQERCESAHTTESENADDIDFLEFIFRFKEFISLLKGVEIISTIHGMMLIRIFSECDEVNIS